MYLILPLWLFFMVCHGYSTRNRSSLPELIAFQSTTIALTASVLEASGVLNGAQTTVWFGYWCLYGTPVVAVLLAIAFLRNSPRTFWAEFIVIWGLALNVAMFCLTAGSLQPAPGMSWATVVVALFTLTLQDIIHWQFDNLVYDMPMFNVWVSLTLGIGFSYYHVNKRRQSPVEKLA